MKLSFQDKNKFRKNYLKQFSFSVFSLHNKHNLTFQFLFRNFYVFFLMSKSTKTEMRKLLIRTYLFSHHVSKNVS